MSPPDEAAASAPPHLDNDGEAMEDRMNQGNDLINPLVDSEDHVEPPCLTRKSDHVESSIHAQDSAELSGTTTRTAHVKDFGNRRGEMETDRDATEGSTASSTLVTEEPLGETSITGSPADSHLGRTLFERYVEYGSSPLWSDGEDEMETTTSEEMGNETDPIRLHDYIRELKEELCELKQELCDVQEVCDKAVDELCKYYVGDSVGESWIHDRLVAIHQSLQACSYKLTYWRTLRPNWPLVNVFLLKNYCVFLSGDRNPGPEIFDLLESELLTFATASILWKTFFDSMLLGATEDECSVLRKLQGATKRVNPPMHPDAVNRWRADTFRIVAASSGYKCQVSQQCDYVTDLILKMLSTAGYTDEEVCGDRGYLLYLTERVLNPAAEIATEMKCCEDEYFWSWLAPQTMMRKRDLKRFEVYDLKSHCAVVQPEVHFANLSDNDTLGECLFSMFPALYKRGKAGEPNSVVSRGCAVVVLHRRLANWCGVDAEESPQFSVDDDYCHILGLENLRLT